MSLHNIPNPQPIRNRHPIPKLQELLKPITPPRNIIRPRMHLTPILHRVLQPLHIMRRHPLRVRQYLRDALRNSYLIDTEVGVWGDDRTSGKVDAFAGEVSAEAALFAL